MSNQDPLPEHTIKTIKDHIQNNTNEIENVTNILKEYPEDSQVYEIFDRHLKEVKDHSKRLTKLLENRGAM